MLHRSSFHTAGTLSLRALATSDRRLVSKYMISANSYHWVSLPNSKPQSNFFLTKTVTDPVAFVLASVIAS